MKIRLGYVGISLTLEDTSYCKSVTYTKYQKLSNEEKKIKINQIITSNLKNFITILKYNYQNKIEFFRMSSTIIPLATHPNIKIDYITPYKKTWDKIKKIIDKYKIRIDTHPNQYCILNSKDNKIIKNSIEILKYHYNLFQILNINGKAIIHVGGYYNNKEESIKRFIENVEKLPQYLKDIIILENDDKIYDIKDTLEICEKIKIPMCLDYHHYKCNNNNQNLEDYLPRIINTWNHTNLPPKMHFSSPKSKKLKRAHSDYINYKEFIKFINIIKKYNTNIDIMLECKAKDKALFTLVRQLKIYSNFKIKNNTIIINNNSK